MSTTDHRGSASHAISAEAVALVQKLSSGEATPAEIEAAAKWRQQSAEHEMAFAEASRVWGKVRSAAKMLAQDDNDVFAELDRLRRRSTMSRRALLGGGVAALAATAYGAVHPPLGLWPSFAELRADYRTRTGEQRQVTIADDIAVRLNTQTSLSVDRSGGPDERIELVTGEASFALPAQPAKSLVILAAAGKTIVQAGRADLRLLGTGDAARVSVTCFDGQCRTELGSTGVDLQPGHRVLYNGTNINRVASVDPADASAWQRGIVEFRGTRLADAIEEINRYRPGQIILANRELGQKQLSGRFRIDQMDMVLVQLEQAFSAHVRNLPGGIVILT